jgi:hypothetical protein
VIVFFVLAVVLLPGWFAATQSTTTDDGPILNHLNAAISWFRHVVSLDVAAGQPSDVLYLENALGVATGGVINVGTFTEGQKQFLDYHRESVLLQARH